MGGYAQAGTLLALKNVVLFTGENEYELREERGRWIAEFRRKHGDDSLIRLDSLRLRLREVLDEAAVGSFLAERRMIVLEGIPSFDRESMSMLISQVHPQTVLLFVAPKPDRRLGGVKVLLEEAEVRTFAPRRGAALETWITAELAAIGAALEPAARTRLLDRLGDNQALLHHELRKLALFAGDRAITADDVEQLVVTAAAGEDWGFIGPIGRGDLKAALQEVRRLQQQGDTPAGIWPKFLWLMSQLTPVYAAVAAGARTPVAITKQSGVNPRTAGALLPMVKRLQTEDLRRLVTLIADYDCALKTGAYRSTGEEPQELAAILDKSLLHCCR